MPALLREALRHVDEVSPGMSQAVGQEGGELLRIRSSTGHPHIWMGGPRSVCLLCEKVGEVLPRVLVPGKEERDLPVRR